MLRSREESRRSGSTLVEVSMALGLLALISTSSYVAILRSVQHQEQVFESYRASWALADLAAEMQDVANRLADGSAKQGIEAVYSRYQGQTFPVASLPGGVVEVKIYANEASVPVELGGPQDLNFDGDAEDDLDSIASGNDLRVVPVLLIVSWSEGGARRSASLHRLITRTAS